MNGNILSIMLLYQKTDVYIKTILNLSSFPMHMFYQLTVFLD